MTSHTLFVCTTCAKVRAASGSTQPCKSGGQKLLEALNQLAQDWPLRDRFTIQPVECMFVCEKSCAISFSAPGKYTYLFGNLSLYDPLSAILDCASQYHHHPIGLLPYGSRPDPLKTTVLARIPPQPVAPIAMPSV
ncbi:MAG: DUF1636 domain-containing protein [Elainella sp. Prado103]|jgi:predicted metal-binding protein|nr:DUF1636 domain-containing protein [Elainella sp. Prado103]